MPVYAEYAAGEIEEPPEEKSDDDGLDGDLSDEEGELSDEESDSRSDVSTEPEPIEPDELAWIGPDVSGQHSG